LLDVLPSIDILSRPFSIEDGSNRTQQRALPSRPRLFAAHRFDAPYRVSLEHGEPALDTAVSSNLEHAIDLHRAPGWARQQKRSSPGRGKKGGKSPQGTLFPFWLTNATSRWPAKHRHVCVPLSAYAL